MVWNYTQHPPCNGAIAQHSAFFGWRMFEVGGRHYTVNGQNFRVLPVKDSMQYLPDWVTTEANFDQPAPKNVRLIDNEQP